MARPERFELPTTKFVAWYSIQLSYGRVKPLIIRGARRTRQQWQRLPRLPAPRSRARATPTKKGPGGPFCVLAEREGFEPSIELLTLYSLSRGAPSASRAPLRILPRTDADAALAATQFGTPPDRRSIEPASRDGAPPRGAQA